MFSWSSRRLAPITGCRTCPLRLSRSSRDGVESERAAEQHVRPDRWLAFARRGRSTLALGFGSSIEVMKPLRDTPGHGFMGKTLSLVVILAIGILSVPATGAPQPGKVYKIGVLHPGSGSEERLAALLAAGYIDGRNLVSRPHYAQGSGE